MTRLRAVVPVVLALCLAATAAFGIEMMSIQVKEGRLRATPSFLGKVVSTVPYGTRVAIVKRQGEWIEVGIPTGVEQGWIHASALTEKRIKMTAGGDDVSAAATGDELALAGKGFNKQVEQQFRSENPDMDFTWVDRMETWDVSAGEIAKFMEKGGLVARGGAQ